MDLYTFLRTLALVITTLMLFKYVLYMLIAPFYSVKEKYRKIKAIKKLGKKYFEYKPRISVIIPAWNEEVGITKTIESIIENNYLNTEIVVIPNGCTDNTERVVESFIKKFEEHDFRSEYITIKMYALEQGGKGIALNHGIRNATGDIIMTVDADSALDNNALYNLVDYFKDEDIDAVVGNVKVANNFSLIGFIQRLEYIFGFYFKRTHAVMGSEYIFGGACAAFRKEVFDRIGLFDEVNKTEDIEMSMRVSASGMKSTYAENVVCYTEGASDFKGLINQRLRWKKGRFDTFIRYRSMFFSSDRRHNKFLSWLVLPYALLSEFQLIFEPIAISLLLAYSIISAEFVSLTLGILFIFIIYLISSFFTEDGIKPEIILLFPASWMLFYILVWVEFIALIQGARMVLKGENIQWQEWQRKGIYDYR